MVPSPEGSKDADSNMHCESAGLCRTLFIAGPTLKPRTEEEGRRICVFALSLLRVKITKDLEKAADGNGREMRHAHAPLWAKEAIRVNDELKGVLENMESLEEDDYSLPEAIEISMGLLKVHRVMTVSEVEKLEGF